MARTTRTRKARVTRKTPAMQRWIASTSAAVSAVARRAIDARGEVLARAGEARESVVARMGEARTRTGAAISQLENVFERRVGGALVRLGVPSPREVRQLAREVARLQRAVEQLRQRRARA